MPETSRQIRAEDKQRGAVSQRGALPQGHPPECLSSQHSKQGIPGGNELASVTIN